MMAQFELAVSELVPHSGVMSLLTRVVRADETSLVAEVEVPVSSLFSGTDGVGAWVGIEYMAQAIAAWAGWQSRQRGAPPQVGLLLGCRRYECSQPSFVPGSTLQVHVECSFRGDAGVSQFDCRIDCGATTLARAALNVFEPDDITEFLKDKQDE